LLLLDEVNRVLLFRFVFGQGALAGEDFWATPGGALEEGETFPQAARRELLEETGLAVEVPDEPVAKREFFLLLTTGEEVLAKEEFFLLHVARQAISSERWTELEKEVMVEHRWWSMEELGTTTDTYFPENLMEVLKSAGV
jgi:8-oxo-dGTP pyrophosphatase MutT (NUDIX family)